MTDKVQKIREEVVRMHNILPVIDGDNISVNYADRICTTLEMYIDSLQEEPVSEDLEEAIEKSFIYHDNRGDDFRSDEQIETAYWCGFETGAKWKEEQMMKDAINATVFCESLKIPTIGHFLHKTNLKENDKVKVIIIKSE